MTRHDCDCPALGTRWYACNGCCNTVHYFMGRNMCPCCRGFGRRVDECLCGTRKDM